ncbi:MAG: AAA family ATPase, partial [Myxococcota bacterium]
NLKGQVEQLRADRCLDHPVSRESYLIAEVLGRVAQWDDVKIDRIVPLEIAFLGALEHSPHRSLRLFEGLERESPLFVHLLTLVYRAEHQGETDSNGSDEDQATHTPPDLPYDTEARRNRARNVDRILELWNRYPGYELDGEEREARLLKWSREVLKQAKEQDRLMVAVFELAKVLARAPGDPDDDIWPCRAARVLLKERIHPDLGSALKTAKFNLRGVTTRAVTDGGAQERSLAARLRSDANALRIEWPHAAHLLDRLADRYESDAAHEDQRVRALGLRVRDPNRELDEPLDSSGDITEREPSRPSLSQDDIGPPEITHVERLAIAQVGPAAQLEFEFASRLNLLTGDNSLGKTFVLDVLWWALTGSWPEYPAWPGAADADSSGPPWIELGADDTAARSTFRRSEERWHTPDNWPTMRGLVIYARVDGGFSVWDPARPASNGAHHPPGLHFTPREVFDGKKLTHGAEEISVCKGLIADWIDWEARKPELFQRFAATLDGLSEPPTIELGTARRIRTEEDRDYPHLRLPYGELPIIHVSAAVKRILRLAYIMVWTWANHREITARLSESSTDRLVVLIDEVESHLHPTWQRVLLPALLRVIRALGRPLGQDDSGKTGHSLQVQLIASTHAPLVMASVEPDFDPEIDRLFHFALADNEVTASILPWNRHGDVSAWLTSEVFGLEQPRHKPAEQAIHDALALYRQDQPDGDEIARVDNALRKALGQLDPFWVRWRQFVKMQGNRS